MTTHSIELEKKIQAGGLTPLGKLKELLKTTVRSVPGVVKVPLWMWSRAYIWPSTRGNAPAVPINFTRIANLIGYRVPANATLGNGMKMVVPWNDDGGHAVFEHGYYEQDTVDIFRKLLSPGMVVFDIGANIGQYSLVASERVGKTGKVHGFEPDPTTFAWLDRNIKLNQSSNVALNQVALFSESGKKTLYLANARDTGSNSFAIPWTFSGRTCEVTCSTVNDYLRKEKITHVDVLKIDVEGSELAILRGASALMDAEDKPVLLVEFEEERQAHFGTSCAHLANFLMSKGYALYKCSKPPLEPYVSGPDNPYTLNVLAIPKDRVSAVLKMIQ
jgi:FkbM family methyltransferase